MSIELHCPQCAKLIRAPDEAGGKRGKCPYCKNTVYIPRPPDESEEIGLAPIGDEEERRAEELRREDIEYATAVDKDTGLAPDTDGAASPAGGGPDDAPAPGEVVDLGGEVEAYILAMHGSKLDAAEAAAARLKRAGTRARDYVQGLLLDEIPPQIQDVPQPLVQGFLKNLLNRLAEV